MSQLSPISPQLPFQAARTHQPASKTQNVTQPRLQEIAELFNRGSEVRRSSKQYQYWKVATAVATVICPPIGLAMMIASLFFDRAKIDEKEAIKKIKQEREQSVQTLLKESRTTWKFTLSEEDRTQEIQLDLERSLSITFNGELIEPTAMNVLETLMNAPNLNETKKKLIQSEMGQALEGPAITKLSENMRDLLQLPQDSIPSFRIQRAKSAPANIQQHITIDQQSNQALFKEAVDLEIHYYGHTNDPENSIVIPIKADITANLNLGNQDNSSYEVKFYLKHK